MSSTPHRTTRTRREVEDKVLAVRQDLRVCSVLGEYGAEAIHAELIKEDPEKVVSVRTIGRILHRRGALDQDRRFRRRAPPKGWYLGDVRRREVELDSFDVVEGLVIQGGIDVEVLNGVSLHGRLVASWATSTVTAKIAVEKLAEHWQQAGLPGYAQFDNDTRFQGAHQHRDSFSRVMRLCLSLEVVPVFAPPREHGFQAAVESFNGLWQTKVWSRFHHEELLQLQERSDLYVAAHRLRTAIRRHQAPSRRAFPGSWGFELQAPLRGRVIFIRRTDPAGGVFLLGRRFPVSRHWLHRLVRCDVDLDGQQIRFFALRRSQPEDLDLLTITSYTPPSRRFVE